MIEALMLVASNMFVGAVLIWVIINEAPYSPPGGKGWFAIRTGAPTNEKNNQPLNTNQKPGLVTKPQPRFRSPR